MALAKPSTGEPAPGVEITASKATPIEGTEASLKRPELKLPSCQQ
jgi:hypothetical protein